MLEVLWEQHVRTRLPFLAKNEQLTIVIAAPKPKRVIRPDLIPDKTRDKGFHEYFIAELSELYDGGDPKGMAELKTRDTQAHPADIFTDTREVPLRRQEDYYVFAKELAASARAGAARPQADAEKKIKKKSHIHYNGDRKTTNYTWEDFEIRLLLCMIIRGVHTSGTPGTTDRWSKRRIMESRRSLNDSLPKATDGHTHRGQWAYHDVAKLLNFHTNDEIPVVDVRDMIHRLVDQRKGALHLANRVHAPRMTKTVAMAWKRQQDFVGDLKEWCGEKGKEGRKARLKKLDKERNELAHELAQNPMQQVEGDPGIDAGNLGQAYTQEDARRNAAGGGDPFADDFDGFVDAAARAQAVGGFDEWDGSNNFVAPPAAQPVNDNFGNDAPASASGDVARADAGGDEWGDDDGALANTLTNAIQAMEASVAAPRRPASPVGAFGMEDPFAAPLPGNTGFKDVAPAASSDADGGFDDASAPAQAVGGFDDWGGNDDFATPPAGQPSNNSFGDDAPTSASKDVSMVDAGGNEWVDENSDQSAPAPAKIPGGNADAFFDDMMANTSIVSRPAVHQFGGFTAVNAPSKVFTSTHPPPASAPAAPQQSLNIDSATGFNAERFAMLSREDTLPSKSPKKVFRNAGGFSPTPGGQVFGPVNVGGVAGSNAIPLAFNRLTGQCAEPKPALSSAPRAAGGDSDGPFRDNDFGSGSGRSGGGASTPVQGLCDSPRGGNDGPDNGGGWDNTPPAQPAKGGHVDLDAANADAWGDGELDY